MNVVAPGFIETPMTDVLDNAQTAAFCKGSLGRLGGSEIAASVVFLASQEADILPVQRCT